MDRKCGDVNYDDVGMDMSDSGDSDNEMFANKKEYDAFKQHFSSKSNKAASGGLVSEYGGEYGGDADQESEYGGGTDKISVVGNKFASQQPTSSGSDMVGGGKSSAVMSVGDKKVERKPMLYGDKHKRSPERRSKSKERHHRRSHSRDRDDRRRRSRSRDRRRSRSRSPNRRGHHRGGWGRDRDRDRDRRREREEGARNHEEQIKKAREMGVEIPKYLKPGAVNPLSYAEQMQKRKALWSKPSASSAANTAAAEEQPEEKHEPVINNTSNIKSAGGSYNNWESTNFGNDKVNEKFRRLMGIKSGGGNDSGVGVNTETKNTPKPQAPGSQGYDKIMNDLDRNYEAARQQTHRNRGIGLGFADSGLAPAPPEPAPTQPPTNNMFRNTGWQNRPSGGINFVKKQ